MPRDVTRWPDPLNFVYNMGLPSFLIASFSLQMSLRVCYRYQFRNGFRWGRHYIRSSLSSGPAYRDVVPCRRESSLPRFVYLRHEHHSCNRSISMQLLVREVLMLFPADGTVKCALIHLLFLHSHKPTSRCICISHSYLGMYQCHLFI
jgi:hypothetical protein